MALEVLGMLFSVVLLMVLVYRGFNVIVVGIVCSILLMALTGVPLVEGLASFSGGAGGFMVAMMTIYIVGTILGEIYSVTGASASIAKSLMGKLKGNREHASPLIAISIVYTVASILVFGGVHVVALNFILVPLTLPLMKESNIPRAMCPAIVIGAAFAGAISLPFAPTTTNAVAPQFLGTTPAAGMVAGFIAGIFVIVLNITLLTLIAKRLNAKGIGFTGGVTSGDTEDGDDTLKTPPNPWIAAIPLAIIFILFNAFSLHIVYSILIGSAVAVVLLRNHFDGLKGITSALGKGAENSGVILIAGAVMGGFGGVIAVTNAFGAFAGALVNFQGPPLLVVSATMMGVTAVSGTAPAGLTIGLTMFNEIFMDMGASAEAIHRVGGFATNVFDTLPSNAVFIAIATLSGLTIRQSYKYVAVTTVLATGLGAILVAVLMTAFPGWY